MIFAVLERRLIQLLIKWLQFFINNLLYKPSYSQFYVQIVNFSLPRQQGSVCANLNDTMKLADLKNHQFGTRIWDIFPIQAEL